MPAPADRPVSPREALTGTSLPSDAPAGPVLPFAERGGEGPFSSSGTMTLEQYALFRAHLVVNGEDDAETWKAFGVGSPPAKEALQARFVWLFKQDAAAQATFIELVRRLSTQLRAQPPAR
jgi:hypothetical protein